MNWIVTLLVALFLVTAMTNVPESNRGSTVQLALKCSGWLVAAESEWLSAPDVQVELPAMLQFPLGRGEPIWIDPAWSAVKSDAHLRTWDAVAPVAKV